MSLPYGFRSKYEKFIVKGAPGAGGYYLVVLDKGSVHVPGDKRSRTHPGHGYPAHTVNYRDVVIFEFGNDETSWRAATLELYQADSDRKDVWSFLSHAPVRPKVTLELT